MIACVCVIAVFDDESYGVGLIYLWLVTPYFFHLSSCDVIVLREVIVNGFVQQNGCVLGVEIEFKGNKIAYNRVLYNLQIVLSSDHEDLDFVSSLEFFNFLNFVPRVGNDTSTLWRFQMNHLK